MESNVIFRDGDLIILESSTLRVVIDPPSMGRIRSFESKRTNWEYLFQDPRTEFEGPGFSDHDTTGYCDCFPTVSPCLYPEGTRKGMDMGDHGWLWQKPWKAEVAANGAIAMSTDVPLFQCWFQRICSLDGENSLRLDYTIKNYGNEPVKYLYSAHPLLNGNEYTRLEFPDEMRKAYVYFALNYPKIGGERGAYLDWPPPESMEITGPFTIKKASATKLFSDRLERGIVAIRQLDLKEALLIEFDTTVLPYVGVLACQGYDVLGDGSFVNSIFLGIEPTTGIGDDLNDCISTNTVQTILPDEEIRFWVRLSLRDES